MKFESITIKDIAKALGLSTSTVSRALRGSYEISEETKKVVLAFAEEHNYRPNPIALSLKEKRTLSIGLVVCEIANSFFSQIINGIESVAYDRGYNVIITQSQESYKKEIANLQYLTSRGVDGLIISVSSESEDFEHLQQLHNKGMRLVFLDRVVPEIDTHKVTIDNFEGAYKATRHLIEQGFTRIAHISNPLYISISRERDAGYRKALADGGLPYEEDLVARCMHGGQYFSEVEEALNRLYALPQPPDAIFASTDRLTTTCLRYCKQHNIEVPRQVSLIGFSNLDLTDLITPALSVVRQPAYEMGRQAVELLIQMIESKRPVTEFEKRVLTAEVIIRESSIRYKGE